MVILFFTALALGFVFNAAPGAVFAETVREGIHGGFRSALAVQLGSLVGDAVWAILGLIGIGLLLQLDALQTPIGIAGAVYLTWLAYDSWLAASKEFRVGGNFESKNTSRALRSGVILSITNPQNIAYWAALGSAMSTVGIADPEPVDYGIFFAGFMASSIIWSFLCAAIVDRVFGAISSHWARLTYRFCAIAFFMLALGSIKGVFSGYI